MKNILLMLHCLFLSLTVPAFADNSVYDLAKQKDTTQLQHLLSENPRAWDTGEDFLGDTPVGIAITEANMPALKLFVKNGYDLNPDVWFAHPVRLISPYTGTNTLEHMEVLGWVLSKIDKDKRNSDIDYHLTDFVESNHLEGARQLLEYGVDPNLWVNQFYSIWDLAKNEEMRSLLESHGAKSNFRRLIVIIAALVIVLVLLARFILKPKQAIKADGSAAKPERNVKKGNLFIAASVMLLLSGFGLILLTRYGSVLGIGRSDAPFIFLAIGIAIVAFGLRLGANGHKLKTRDAEDVLKQKTLQQTGDRPTFLYLRSFILDEEDGDNSITLPYGLNVPVNPWESTLALAFGRVGDVIAIGRPGEKLATTGALRLYVNDDEWQDKVLEMVEKSDLVIWTYGATEGLRWEISRLINIIPPEKLVLAIPVLNMKMKKRDKIWQDAIEKLNKIFPKPFPKEIGQSLFISFDKDWTASWVDTQKPKLSLKFIATLGTWTALGAGAKTLLKERGYHYPGFSRGEKFLVVLLSFLGWIVVGVVLVMFYGLIRVFS